MNFVKQYLNRLFIDTAAANRRTILAMLDPLPGGRLLDMGCGDGAYTKEWAARVQPAELHGVEIWEDAVSVARERGLTVHIADLNEPLPLLDSFFDVILCNQVLDHLYNPDNLLREVHRLLRPNGYAIISIGNIAAWHNILSLGLGFQPPLIHASPEVLVGNPLSPFADEALPSKGHGHLRVWAWMGFRDLLKHHGLRILAMCGCGWYPLPPSMASIMCRLDRMHSVYLIAKVTK